MVVIGVSIRPVRRTPLRRDPLRNGQAHLCTIVHKLTVRSRCRPPLHAGRCEAHCVLTVNVLGAVWNCQAAAVSVRRRGALRDAHKVSCTAILIRPDAGAPLRLTSSSAGALSLVVPRSVTAHGVYSFVGAKRKGLGRPADRPFGCRARLTERGLRALPGTGRRQDALSPIVSSQCDMAIALCSRDSGCCCSHAASAAHESRRRGVCSAPFAPRPVTGFVSDRSVLFRRGHRGRAWLYRPLLMTRWS